MDPEGVGSNLGRDIGYPDPSFSLLSTLFPGKSWDSILGHDASLYIRSN
jgi:hypothetical protein